MNLREAAQQALEALEQCGLNDERRSYEQERAAITALRAALAEDAMQRLTDVQQEMERQDGTGKTSDHIPDATKMVPTINEMETVEPVAWMVYTLDGKSAFITDNPEDFTPEHRALPLYTAPTKRDPLTNDEIRQVVDRIDGVTVSESVTFRLFARAIERAHGIGGE